MDEDKQSEYSDECEGEPGVAGVIYRAEIVRLEGIAEIARANGFFLHSIAGHA